MINFKRLYITLPIYFGLTFFSFWIFGQNTDSYKVRYIKYSPDKKIIKDTMMLTTYFPIYNTWIYVVGNDTLSNGAVPCGCSITVYDSTGKVLDEVYDPAGDNGDYMRTSYSYNTKGQLISKSDKFSNMPWLSTKYFYDAKSRLVKEDCSSARYGDCFVEYIYDKDTLLYKIKIFDGWTDTIK